MRSQAEHFSIWKRKPNLAAFTYNVNAAPILRTYWYNSLRNLGASVEFVPAGVANTSVVNTETPAQSKHVAGGEAISGGLTQVEALGVETGRQAAESYHPSRDLS